MAVAAIICEFNPLHNGHLRLLDAARAQAGPEGTVLCLMSGNYVQRGEPALLHRLDRAAAALACGADLVLELPLTAAVASAAGYARGGVGTLAALGTGRTAGTTTGRGVLSAVGIGGRFGGFRGWGLVWLPDGSGAGRGLRSGCLFSGRGFGSGFRGRGLAAAGPAGGLAGRGGHGIVSGLCIAAVRDGLFRRGIRARGGRQRGRFFRGRGGLGARSAAGGTAFGGGGCFSDIGGLGRVGHGRCVFLGHKYPFGPPEAAKFVSRHPG